MITVPQNQGLVIEQVSGDCNFSGIIQLWAYQSGASSNWQYLPANFLTGAYSPASTPVRFYMNPGLDFDFYTVNTSAFRGACLLSASGYYIDLP